MPAPSVSEGVRILPAACAATPLIHGTPPPFNVGIVPEDFNCCQAFAENSFTYRNFRWGSDSFKSRASKQSAL
jgi:hypothetical protein